MACLWNWSDCYWGLPYFPVRVLLVEKVRCAVERGGDVATRWPYVQPNVMLWSATSSTGAHLKTALDSVCFELHVLVDIAKHHSEMLSLSSGALGCIQQLLLLNCPSDTYPQSCRYWTTVYKHQCMLLSTTFRAWCSQTVHLKHLKTFDTLAPRSEMLLEIFFYAARVVNSSQ